MHTFRTLALSLVVGLVAGTGFFAAQAVADQFADVPAANPFAGDIGWLTDQGLASGFPDGTFRPTAPVKRQQLARWMNNYNQRMDTAVASTNPAAASTFSATVDCPEGRRAVAGSGAATAGLGLTQVASYPSETFQWQVEWENVAGNVVDPSLLQVIAFCVPAVPS
jgi:hypothetical protein